MGTSVARKALIAASVVLAVMVAALVLWKALDFLLLIFASVLFAIILRAGARGLAAYTPLGTGAALVVVVLAFFAVLTAVVWIMAPNFVNEMQGFYEKIPEINKKVQQSTWGRRIIGYIPEVTGGFLAKVAGFFSTTFGAAANTIIVMLMGIYFAANPRQYLNGVVRLFPIAKRKRAREVLDAVGYTLEWWLLGKGVGMLFVAIVTTTGLLLLGVPVALGLGLLAGLLDFIPNIGPPLSAIPAILLGLLVSPMTALYVALLYIGAQSLENYIAMPLIQRHTIKLSPAVTIGGQIFLGVVLGGPGLILAAPLTAALVVVIEMVYLEDVLGDEAPQPLH